MHTMSNNRGSRALRRRPSSTTTTTCEKKQQIGSERKMRTLQSLQERFCFTLKRPRTSRARPSKGGPNSSPENNGGKSTLMENGLIQIPHFHCDYYYESLSLSSNYSQENTLSTSSPSSSASSSITQVGLVYSPISSLENSSDDGFSSDEVMSLVGCSDLIKENVLDFMPSTLEGHGSKSCPDTCQTTTSNTCETTDAALDSCKEVCSSSSVEDDGEPYRIDLCDFEPDVSATNSCSNEQQEEGPQNQKKYGGQVLCLRLDYEEVLRAWKERGEFFIAKEPSNYPSPYLDPFHTFSHAPPFVPHPPYF